VRIAEIRKLVSKGIAILVNEEDVVLRVLMGVVVMEVFGVDVMKK
jgi:hypothetical protein